MASFEARYEGICPGGDTILPGEMVAYDEEDDLWHQQCLREERARKVPTMPKQVCPECHLVKPCWHD